MTPHPAAPPVRYTTAIALVAFLTVVDLFATQAILPSLARAYGVSAAAMGLAVNACTLGMAAGGLAVALFGARLPRRRGVMLALGLLALPTALLAHAPDLATFAALRVAQGVFMSAAFTLTLAYLGEACSAGAAAGAFAAYITGNVASNLIGRLAAAGLADHAGLAVTFYAFAGLNLAGVLLARSTLGGMTPAPAVGGSPLAAWRAHFASPPLRAGFAIGFCILFAFIGTFTYVNFVLVGDAFMVDAMALGLIYLIFLPSIVTTPLAGAAVRRFGTRATFWGATAVALAGAALLLSPRLEALLLGLALVGVGTFFAQATATGFVGRAAGGDRAAASGLYLASYFLGGLAGSAVLGQLFERFGWAACVAGVTLALAAAGVLAVGLRLPAAAAVSPPAAR